MSHDLPRDDVTLSRDPAPPQRVTVKESVTPQAMKPAEVQSVREVSAGSFSVT